MSYQELLGSWSDIASEVSVILAEAWFKTTGEDLSNPVKYQAGQQEIVIPEVEARLYGYLYAGAKVAVARKDGEVIGVLLYTLIFDGLIAVRMLYVLPETGGSRVGKGLINLVRARRLIFQTLKNNPPLRLHQLTQDKRRLIDETDVLLTWEMEWRP